MMTGKIKCSANNSKLISSTRIAFFVVGFILASWAPLIPILKYKLGISDGDLSILLIAFGVGSISSMFVSGVLAAKFGCRIIYLFSVILATVLLPVIMTIDNFLLIALFISLFGASVGAMDVIVNIQAVQVEKIADRSLMPRFHALFSFGAFIGVCTTSLLLLIGLTANLCLLLTAVIIATLLRRSVPNILREVETSSSNNFVFPKGKVILLGLLCFIAYIVEGSMLDWSGVLLVDQHAVSIRYSGIGYAVFSVTMTIGRFYGGYFVDNLGKSKTFLISSFLAFIGLIMLWLSSGLSIAVLAFLMIGLGVANIAPLLFTAAGNQSVMPVTLAVAAISTIGYSGILMGPGIVGAIAHFSSISDAFLVLALFSSFLIVYSIKDTFKSKSLFK